MATMIPELSEQQLDSVTSQAEAKVYRAFRDCLPKEYVVLFQVGWILKREHDQARDGEADFLICHPDQGFLCVEVKGGGVGYDADKGQWYSVDRHQQKHDLNNPVSQALRAKYSILSKLNDHPKWTDKSFRNVLRGHAVFFPDIGDAHILNRADLPVVLVGTVSTLHNPREWVEKVFSYWQSDSERYTPIGRMGIDILKEIFARSFFAAPVMATRLADQEVQRLRLTEDQMRILDLLRSHRRVAVSGGAGTGKTVLAMEKARRLAAEGFHTLLTCYNRQLADHLSHLCAHIPNLDVMGFHQLCHRWVERASRQSGRDLLDEARMTYPGTDFYNVQLPNALGYSLEVLADRYDAIVCDEGQDFCDDFWIPLELLLTDIDSSPFYVFFDDNQNIYARVGTFPITEPPFTLTTNCRNTAPIHSAAYRHYKGIPVTPPDIEGDDVMVETSPNIATQAKKIGSHIVDWVSRQNVAPDDITILIADAHHKADYYASLKGLPLPRPAQWQLEGERAEHSVLVDTIQRFKGLESTVVILWGLDTLDIETKRELLYVGMSRAKSMLVIVGNAETCATIECLGY